MVTSQPEGSLPRTAVGRELCKIQLRRNLMARRCRQRTYESEWRRLMTKVLLGRVIDLHSSDPAAGHKKSRQRNQD
jgi:hypothetical protein